MSEHIHIVSALVIDEIRTWMLRCVKDGIITSEGIDGVKIVPCTAYLGVDMVDI